MNYIKRLEADKLELLDMAINRAEKVQEFREYLQSSKFGPQADGSRGDWIATADVERWLRYIDTPCRSGLNFQRF